MVIDTSAFVAYALNEPAAARITAALERAPRLLLSTASLVESSVVLVGRVDLASALARERGEPLPFVGNDFARTDVDAAPY